jgi:hypothetical protein
MNYDKDYAETPSLDASEEASRAVQRTPNRVSLDQIKAKIGDIEYMHPALIPHMTICVVILDNGYAVVGKSAPADPDNFDPELGNQFAYEDALRQVWPLEAYLLRQEMTYTERAEKGVFEDHPLAPGEADT